MLLRKTGNATPPVSVAVRAGPVIVPFVMGSTIEEYQREKQFIRLIVEC